MPDKKTSLRFSVVLPAYNEEVLLPETVRKVNEALHKLKISAEIIIVEDGSTDQTYEVARRLARSDKKIKIVRHPQNRGYGAALCSGFQAARRPWIFVMDSDGQFDPQEISLFLPRLQGGDVLVGIRQKRRDTFFRFILGRFWTSISRLVLGVKVADMNCGFKVLRRSLVSRLKLVSSGGSISAEILAKATVLGMRIVEIPVTHYPREVGRQTGGTARVALKALKELYLVSQELRTFRAAGPGKELPL